MHMQVNICQEFPNECLTDTAAKQLDIYFQKQQAVTKVVEAAGMPNYCFNFKT